ncbi:hypothetical protein ABIC29_000766 [Agromyces sp. PvR057]
MYPSIVAEVAALPLDRTLPVLPLVRRRDRATG